MGPSELSELICTPSHPEMSRIEAFRHQIASKYKINLADFEAFRHWSVDNPALSWKECWEQVDIIASKKV